MTLGDQVARSAGSRQSAAPAAGSAAHQLRGPPSRRVRQARCPRSQRAAARVERVAANAAGPVRRRAGSAAGWRRAGRSSGSSSSPRPHQSSVAPEERRAAWRSHARVDLGQVPGHRRPARPAGSDERRVRRRRRGRARPRPGANRKNACDDARPYPYLAVQIGVSAGPQRRDRLLAPRWRGRPAGGASASGARPAAGAAAGARPPSLTPATGSAPPGTAIRRL